MAPLESVMLPSAKVKLPTVEPDAEDVVLENESCARHGQSILSKLPF